MECYQIQFGGDWCGYQEIGLKVCMNFASSSALSWLDYGTGLSLKQTKGLLALKHIAMSRVYNPIVYSTYHSNHRVPSRHLWIICLFRPLRWSFLDVRISGPNKASRLRHPVGVCPNHNADVPFSPSAGQHKFIISTIVKNILLNATILKRSDFSKWLTPAQYMSRTTNLS